jgi:TrwC relaxase
MIRIVARHSLDASYYVADKSLELDGVRPGPPDYWVRGSGSIDASVLERSWRTSPRATIVGYDLIVAAPRTMSILLALGDVREQRQLVADHRDSVHAAMSYLEDRALVVKTTMAGEGIEQRGRWSSILAFTHGVNRIGEPHLHDHVLVGAVPSHRSRVLNRQALSAHILAADAIYRSEMRFRINERGVRRAWRTLGGVDIVQGVDEGHRALWPGARAWGTNKESWTREGILEKWKTDLLRFEPIQMREPPRRTDSMNEQIFGAHFEGALSVARRDLVAATANASSSGLLRGSIEAFVDTHYPELATDRGLSEKRIGVAAARQSALVKARGARPLEVEGVAQWRHRERSRSLERSR